MDLLVLRSVRTEEVHQAPSGDSENPWGKGPVQIESFKTLESLYEHLLGNIRRICLVGNLSGNETINRLIMLPGQG
jgi:hypothetical protein